MSVKSVLKTAWSCVPQLMAGGALGLGACYVLQDTPVFDALYEARGELYGLSARASGGIVFKTANGTEAEKQCLAETKKFVETLPESFTRPIKEYGVYVRMEESASAQVPNYRDTRRTVTLYYDQSIKSCNSNFNAAHELSHAFDAAINLPSDGYEYRANIKHMMESPHFKEMNADPAARAALNQISNGKPDELIRSETFAEAAACKLVPDQIGSNFMGVCFRPEASGVRQYVAATLAR